MLNTITMIMGVILVAIITRKAVVRVISHIVMLFRNKQQEKRAYEAAMRDYLSRQVIDIEH